MDELKKQLVSLMKEVKFSAFPGGSLDVSVAYQLPEHAFEAIAENLIANNVVILPDCGKCFYHGRIDSWQVCERCRGDKTDQFLDERCITGEG